MTPDDLAFAAEFACLVEAAAPKPGNVSPGRPFRDMRFEDFVASALAIGPVLARADQVPLGQAVRLAVEATRRRTAANTNLGIILLFAPLARAALQGAAPLRDGVKAELANTTVADAAAVYEAIRLARPGGLGSVPTADLGQRPTITLLEAMDLARGRDQVAAEYVSGFSTTFEVTLPALRQAREGGLDWADAAVETFLTLLARLPDTLIARKLGPDAAEEVRRGAAAVLEAGGGRRPAGRALLAEFDARLRDPQNSHNPGTTADLVAAGLFALQLEDGLA
ncbi:MAG: triphosphoribosyl-dephospho-CoA synthase [Gemmatimonadales bacterium]